MLQNVWDTGSNFKYIKDLLCPSFGLRITGGRKRATKEMQQTKADVAQEEKQTIKSS